MAPDLLPSLFPGLNSEPCECGFCHLDSRLALLSEEPRDESRIWILLSSGACSPLVSSCPGTGDAAGSSAPASLSPQTCLISSSKLDSPLSVASSCLCPLARVALS